ncbi:MAG TPA: hypothetical protein VMT16_00110 [Thermoanaerobaculia bacterium]|nr:hypothetical protein [Thermoanaerobaculia bacterium]
MDEARRTVARWLLAAFLGYGPGRAGHHWEVARIERPLTPLESRRLSRVSPFLAAGALDGAP